MEEDLTLTNVHFTETINFNKTKLEVYHLILANEDSEAGLLYHSGRERLAFRAGQDRCSCGYSVYRGRDSGFGGQCLQLGQDQQE